MCKAWGDKNMPDPFIYGAGNQWELNFCWSNPGGSGKPGGGG